MKTIALLKCVAFFLATASCHGELPPPAGVRLETLNTHYVLKWDWSRDHNATFTAQYLAKYKLRRRGPQVWASVCVSVRETECDFTSADLNYLGIFVLRVRASTHTHTHTHTLHSAWVNLTFCPDIDAALGPPSRVEVSAEGRGLLELQIWDPVTHGNQSMRTHIPNMYYHIQYWRPDTHTQVEEVNSTVSLLTLSLVEGEVYCTRVQTRYDFYNKSSTYTRPQCIRTTGQTPYWQVALWFLLALVLAFGLVLLLAYGFLQFFRVLKSTYFPSNKLPTHIQEYLQDPPSDRPRLLTPESESSLLIGQMDVEVVPASPPPPDEQSDWTSTRHCCHGSRDSECTHDCCHGSRDSECTHDCCHGGRDSECTHDCCHGSGDSECTHDCCHGGGDSECTHDCCHGSGDSDGTSHSRHGSGDSGMYSAEEVSGGVFALGEKRRGEGDREGQRRRGEGDREGQKRRGEGDREGDREIGRERKHDEAEEDEGVRDVCV